MRKKTKRVKRQNRYPEDLKRKIAKSYLAGEASYSVLAEENGLKNKDVVKEFVKWYRNRYLDSSMTKTEKTDSTPAETSSSSADLLARIAQLEKQLAHRELQVEGLETLIDVAEEELGVSIRKKSGSKQLKR
jgi:transposase-like protein